jgi:peptidoglycan/xylan/chitin deacetylase (PgdA/CDA1 family)
MELRLAWRYFAMSKLMNTQVRPTIEEQVISEVKHDKVYEKITDPVFITDVGFVTLTLDDGPSTHTESILDILAQKNARAIFFMLGENVKKYPAVTRKVIEQGHVIGNHSYSHPYLTKISVEDARKQLEDTSKLIADTTGVLPPYFRPPYGAFNESTILVATQLNMKVVMWSADPRDYSFNTGYSVFNASNPLLESRNILLLHDLKEATVDALPRIIDAIREKNLQTTVQYEH